MNKDFINLVEKYYNDIGTKAINIVDYGGGDLSHYKAIKKAFPHLEFNYTIVEKMIREGYHRYIYEVIDSGIKDIDIFHSNSSLQYSRDIDRDLKDIIRLNPRFIIILTVAITTKETYVVEQKNLSGISWYGGKTIPYLFFNTNYIKDRLVGYRQLYHNQNSFINIERAKLAFPDVPEDEFISANMLFEREVCV